MPNFNKVPGFAKSVRAAMMPKFTYRMRFLAFTITQATNTRLPLLACDDDPDYDQLIDGTSPAECNPGSRIVALQLHFQIVVPSGDNEIIEWVLVKDPDGVLQGATVDNISQLYTQDTGTTQKAMRKYTLAAGHIITDSNHAVPTMIVNVPPKVLRRIGPMQENDNLHITFTATAAAGNATLYGRGRIITRQN